MLVSDRRLLQLSGSVLQHPTVLPYMVGAMLYCCSSPNVPATASEDSREPGFLDNAGYQTGKRTKSIARLGTRAVRVVDEYVGHG